MGASSSKLEGVTNDFEMVVRVAKELDRVLARDFGLSEHRQLGDKIQALKEQGGVSARTIMNMRTLVHWRNTLIHDYDCSGLQDLNTSRYKFQCLYAETQRELASVVAAKQRELVIYRTDTTTAEAPSGWALLGAAVAVGVVSYALAAADEGEEEKRKERRRRQKRSSYHY
ncbi:expressed unknown protein [Seminavis robusta]|uniref:Uncharacterized protein n=1 Tax=Seminavis robusta TaxID=568900 RepID=A0A9N8EFJ7_9STRA|nr:expressed unknown protein [Seminavis robusta]|eukprot:Sro1050_g235540.1 n/a (171) ;mRNA; r:18737-19249